MKAIKNQNFKSTIFEIKILGGRLTKKLNTVEGKVNEMKGKSMLIIYCEKERKLKFIYS